MALIPITFNADDASNEKKGKIKGQDLAMALLAGMSNKVGVLNVLENACQQYGAINVSTGYATITLHAGYIVIFGRLIYIEEGTQVQVALPQSGTVTGSFGIRINLSESGGNEVTWFTKTDLLQTDDLSKNVATGIYEFRLYTYSATPSGLSLSAFTNERIYLMNDYLKMDAFETAPNEDNSGKLATTRFVQNLIEIFRNNINYNYRGFTEGEVYPPQLSVFGIGHWYKVFDIFNLRIIYGNAYNLPKNQDAILLWKEGTKINDVKVKLATLSYGKPGGDGLNEPILFKTGYEEDLKALGRDGIVLYNSNGVVADADYLIIGERPND